MRIDECFYTFKFLHQHEMLDNMREREREIAGKYLICVLLQGLMEYNKEALAYFKKEGVSVLFLFRHNLLRRYVSILANLFDKEAKLLNGTHKSHVHSRIEVSFSKLFSPPSILGYKFWVRTLLYIFHIWFCFLVFPIGRLKYCFVVIWLPCWRCSI